MSPAARKRMAAAQRKRWAESRGESTSVDVPKAKPPAKKKRKISAQGRAAMAEAQRKRWAAKKKTGEGKASSAKKRVPKVKELTAT